VAEKELQEVTEAKARIARDADEERAKAEAGYEGAKAKAREAEGALADIVDTVERRKAELQLYESKLEVGPGHEPCTLNPKSGTQNPQPYTLNPKL